MDDPVTSSEEGELVVPDEPPPLPEGVSPAWDGPPDDPDETWTEPGELPQLAEKGGDFLPLRHTDVHARVRGHIAEVEVTQTFVSSREHPIEVVYTFPLPENAAVHDLKMVIGDRVIESEIRKRADAQREYDEARATGHTAALLEQERPNVFTQSVANIPAGATIEVEVHYLQTLSHDAGTSELVFPMVVGPRYSPASVTDAGRISPPVLGRGMRSGHDVSLRVEADAGLPIADFQSVAHEVVAKHDGAKLSVQLAKKGELANRDFVLRWRTEAAAPRSVLWMGQPDDGGTGHFELVVEPPHVDLDRTIGRREVVFVVDVSGSMYGPPLALAKRVMREMIAELRPVDTFDVVTFESGTRRLFERPMPANATAITQAIAFIDRLRAGGGTEMAGAVDAALGNEVGAGRNRYVVFATDGYIGNENEIFAAARALVERQQKRGHVSRVFAVGIGSSPNRHLLAGLAQAGHGLPLGVAVEKDAARSVEAMRRWIDARVLDDLTIDWGDMEVETVVPEALPDLFASHAVVVHGRYRGGVHGPIVLRGKDGEKVVEIPVTVAKTGETDDTLRTLWARARVAELEPKLWEGDGGDAAAEITQLGLEHRLVTAYTSLIAIDRSRRVDGSAETIVQPVEAPLGVDPEMAGATMHARSVHPAPLMYDVDDSPAFARRARSSRRSEHEERTRRPTLDLRIASIDGGLREAAVRRGLRGRRNGLQRCFDGAHGIVEVRVTLTPDGGVVVAIRSSSGSADIDRCVDREVRAGAWPRVGASASFVLELRSES